MSFRIVTLTRYSYDLILGLKAYSIGKDYRQIITGVSERGSETGIRYWIQPRSLKPVQPRPKSAKEQMMVFLTRHVRQDTFSVKFT